MTEKVPRKKWASKEERVKHYARIFAKRMRTEDTPQAIKWRARKAETDRRNGAKRTERLRAEREKIKAMTEAVAKDNARKREASRNKKRFDTPIEPRKPSVIEVTPAKPVRPCTDAWIAAGGKVEVLPSQLGQAYVGLSQARIALY